MPKSSDYSNKPRTPSKKSNNNHTHDRIEWKGYINVPLVEADKRHYHQWKAQEGILDEFLCASLEDGYKLSVDYQPRQDAYRASLYCQNPIKAEAGYCLSIFASSWYEALARIVYIHAVKCQFSWEKFLDPRKQVDDWDDYA